MQRRFHPLSASICTGLALSLAAAFAPACADGPRPAAGVGKPIDVAQTLKPPTTEEQNGVRYVTGGIGVEGVSEVVPLGRDMNLKLVFAERGTGAYFADVDVKITDASGREVLTVEGSDPLMFAELKPGDYDVSATVEGQIVEHRIRVPSQGQRTELFQWG